MLHINDLTFRIEGRVHLRQGHGGHPGGAQGRLRRPQRLGQDHAAAPDRRASCTPTTAASTCPRSTRIGWVAQEAPGGPDSLIEFVLAADTERARLLAEAETAHDPGRIADIHERLADIGAHAAPARAARILAGLGFDEAAQQRPCSEFSGGWRMRVALAAMLFAEPDLLLLDEPTNYLDLEGTLWLEDYLRDYPHTVLIVSHDRELLNRSVDVDPAPRRRASSRSTRAATTSFEEARREKQRLDLKLKKKQDDERRHIEAFIDRFKAKASKATQAQSRVKALARMQPIAEQIEERVAPFLFPNPAKAVRQPADPARGRRRRLRADDQPVLQGLDLRLDADDRVGLLGANGNGKSTFAKLIAGRLAPHGRPPLRAPTRSTVGYFAQHQMDDLPAGKTPYEHMLDLMPDATEAQRRARLGALGFGIGKADTKAENLSGGEKARLLFALATFHGPHLLILDEPTNHLDVDAREALVRALNDYEGAVILISHDRHLIEACADRLWIVRGGTRAHLRRRHGPVSRRVPGRARRRSRCAARQGEGERRGEADARRTRAGRRPSSAPRWRR